MRWIHQRLGFVGLRELRRYFFETSHYIRGTLKQNNYMKTNLLHETRFAGTNHLPVVDFTK